MKVYNWIVPIRGELAETIAATLARAGVDFQMKRTEAGYAVGLTERSAYELAVSLKNFNPATEVFEGQQYVVVNTGNQKPWSIQFPDKYPAEMYIIGDDPGTYGLLRNAASLLNDFSPYEDPAKDGHNQVFTLIPVPLDWVKSALKLVKEEDDDGDE